MNDTIAAISTTLGVGAISIIRVSGKEAIEIVNKIFKGKDLTKQRRRQTGWTARFSGVSVLFCVRNAAAYATVSLWQRTASF